MDAPFCQTPEMVFDQASTRYWPCLRVTTDASIGSQNHEIDTALLAIKNLPLVVINGGDLDHPGIRVGGWLIFGIEDRQLVKLRRFTRTSIKVPPPRHDAPQLCPRGASPSPHGLLSQTSTRINLTLVANQPVNTMSWGFIFSPVVF